MQCMILIFVDPVVVSREELIGNGFPLPIILISFERRPVIQDISGLDGTLPNTDYTTKVFFQGYVYYDYQNYKMRIKKIPTLYTIIFWYKYGNSEFKFQSKSMTILEIPLDDPRYVILSSINLLYLFSLFLCLVYFSV